jgi:6-methylsalicylate decarboxylase
MSFIIDLHHHVIPDFYWEASNEGGEAAGGITPPRWSLEGALAYLDESGIDVAHYSNTLARTPDVKYLFSHAGGTIPFVASRFGIIDAMNVIPGAEARGLIADTLPRLYWDTASAFSDPVLHLLRSVTGVHNVVFGSDYPYPRNNISIRGLRQLERTAELDDKERRGVLGETAARLIPRLAAAAATPARP